jgi:hypothetical protein
VSKSKQREKPIDWRALTEDERAKILARIRKDRLARTRAIEQGLPLPKKEYPLDQGIPKQQEVWTKAKRETIAKVAKRTKELTALAKQIAEEDMKLKEREVVQAINDLRARAPGWRPLALEIPVQAYDAMRIFFTNKSWAITRAEVKSMAAPAGSIECELNLRLIQVEPGAPRILVRDAEMLIEILEAILDVSTDRVRVAREPRRKAPAARTRRRLSRGDRV